MSAAAKTSKKNEGRKRFNDEQIRFLEYMFETQSRPELRMKQHLANKLGLHPRQVAIWFQNKRARSKSRLIEHEYNILKHDYNTLASKSESLRHENRALLNQLQMLRDAWEEHQKHKARRLNVTEDSSSQDSQERITRNNAGILSERYSEEISIPFYDDIRFIGEESKFVEVKEELHSSDDWDEENRCNFESELPSWWELEQVFE